MGLFFPDDDYDGSVRQTGFNRYKQLLSERTADWIRTNMLTCIAALPLAAACAAGVMYSSIAVLIPLTILGGMIFGPFYSCLIDNILRGMRDGRGSWGENFRRALSQNFRGSLIPGAVLGLAVGFYTFMGFLMYWQTAAVPRSTILMYSVSAVIALALNTLFWPLLVLFDQPLKGRIINIIAFSSRHIWKVLLVSLIQYGVIFLNVMLAPWSVFLIPLLGWYVPFLCLHILYDDLDAFFRIEEQIQQKEHDEQYADPEQESNKNGE